MLLQKEGARCDSCTCCCDRLGLGLTVTAGGRFSSIVLLSSLLSPGSACVGSYNVRLG